MKRLILLLVLPALLFGCRSYYEVRDLRTDRVYYTRSLQRWKSGAIRFDDEISGATVTLTTHEFKEIPKSEFEMKAGASGAGSGR